MGLTTGDAAAVGMCVIVSGGWVTSMLRNLADKQRLLLTDASEDGKHTAQIRALNATLTTMTATLTKQGDSFREHELKCAEDKSAMLSEVRAITKEQTNQGNRLSSIQQQVSNIAVGMAPGRGVEITPLTRSAG